MQIQVQRWLCLSAFLCLLILCLCKSVQNKQQNNETKQIFINYWSCSYVIWATAGYCRQQLHFKAVRVSKPCLVEDDSVFWCKWCENNTWEYNHTHRKSKETKLLHNVYLDIFIRHFWCNFDYSPIHVIKLLR